MKQNCWPEKWILWGVNIKPPLHIFFNTSCKKHDNLYTKGGIEIDRKVADILFLYYMKLDIYERVHILDTPFYYIWAYLYYFAVRLWWSKHFNYK